MKTTGVIVGVIVILIVGSLAYIGWRGEEKSGETVTENNNNVSGTATNATNTGTTTSNNDGSDSPKMYTMAEVAAHSGAGSCWSVIDKNVYDLTKWIVQHPGGAQRILGLCGKDGSAMFHGQHGTAQKQADILAGMKIGAVAN